ncbi:hypothetical protein [Polaribacter sp.]|uniref:hypothetical protein n=1 Tax=Polaribacter sp. TaxID=1920175 RepID=UPI003F6D21C9
MFTGKDNITTEELGKLAREINAKKVFKRPIVKHKYTQGEWFKSENSIGFVYCLKDKNTNAFSLNINNDGKIPDEEIEANGRLIAQAPKMHQLCEAMFDMLKDTNSYYLPILEDVLNKINPK